MTTPSPSEPDPEEDRVARPLPCPRCESTKGFHRVGKFRSQCTNCNSTVSNEEIGIPNQEPLGESE